VRPNCTTALPCLYLVLVTLDSRDAPYAYFRNLVRGPARGARLLRPVQSGGHRDESAKGSAPPFGVVHVWRPGRRAVSQWVLTRVSEIHTRPRLMVQEEYGITSSFDDGKQRVQPPAMASQDSAVSDDTQVGLFSRAALPQILTHVAVMNPARCCHLSATSASGLTKVPIPRQPDPRSALLPLQPRTASLGLIHSYQRDLHPFVNRIHIIPQPKHDPALSLPGLAECGARRSRSKQYRLWLPLRGGAPRFAIDGAQLLEPQYLSRRSKVRQAHGIA